MAEDSLMGVPSLGTVLSLDKFWQWLHEHHGCIVRAGTNETWLYDFDDLHWHLYDERGGKFGVQLMRGKQIVAEMIFTRSEIFYVEMSPSPESQGHFEFQLLGGPEQDMYTLCHFVLAHGYEDEEGQSPATH